jgi:branched-chain amino acid transport system substrate-binding protein
VAALNLALKEINAQGGILGRKVEYVIGDDQSLPTSAVTEARRLIERVKIDAMIGPIASQLTMAAAPVVSEAKIPWVSVTGTAAMTPQMGPYHFSMNVSTDAQAEAMANYLERTLHVKSVAMLHDVGGNSTGAIEGLKKELPKRGITITGVQSYELTATDMTPQLLSLRKGNPEVLVYASAGTEDGYVLKNRDDIGWNVKIVGTPGLITQPALTMKLGGPNAYHDTVGMNFKSQSYCPNDPLNSSEYVKLKDKLKANEPENYAKLFPALVTYVYDAVYALKAGIEGAKSAGGPQFAAWMEKNSGSIKVVNGTLGANSTTHFLMGASVYTFIVDPEKPRADGMLKRVEGCG